jgi:hypothetical protein
MGIDFLGKAHDSAVTDRIYWGKAVM